MLSKKQKYHIPLQRKDDDVDSGPGGGYTPECHESNCGRDYDSPASYSFDEQEQYVYEFVVDKGDAELMKRWDEEKRVYEERLKKEESDLSSKRKEQEMLESQLKKKKIEVDMAASFLNNTKTRRGYELNLYTL